MDRWKQYLFGQHPESELRSWALRLKYFRYFRAHGGHANDGDSLDVAFSYSSTDELLNIFNEIGYKPLIYSKIPPQPVAVVSYTGDEWSKFSSLIPNAQWIKQPGHCEILGVRVFFWCENGSARISTNPASYIVNNEHVLAAEALELEFKKLNLTYIDPPRDTKNYICPKYYPEFYSVT
ncbi:MAG: hypothetical protein V4660_09930 [Pseudomonadota bacterium]